MEHVIGGTEELPQEECWHLLEGTSVGRLAISIADKPDIFPINYVVEGGSLFFRTGAGTKLAASALLHNVAFEIDGYEPATRTIWSVVVKGRAHQVEHMEEVFAAEELPLFPWAAHPKPNFVRIDSTSVTGRRFHILDDVNPDASIGWEPPHAPPAPSAVVPRPGDEYHPGAPYMRPD